MRGVGYGVKDGADVGVKNRQTEKANYLSEKWPTARIKNCQSPERKMANYPNACDLRVYAEALGGEVRHYHDKMGLECDAVVHLPNGSYALFEVKIGGKHLIDEGARTLTVLSDLIAKKNLREPVFKMIITAVGDYAYVRKEDGIFVSPLSALKP